MIDDFFFYSRVTLYLAGLFYCVFGVIFSILLYKNRFENTSSGLEKARPSPVKSQNSDQASKSASSKFLPIYITLPSLSNSSVITQGTLENMVPNIMSDVSSGRSRSPPDNRFAAKQTKEFESRNRKLAEYKQIYMHGKII